MSSNSIDDDELKNRISSDEEEEGDDLRPQQAAFDSSEEEEDDDEEEIERIREGFIVDDDEENDTPHRRKRHRRREKRSKSHDQDKQDGDDDGQQQQEDEEGILDEDDLDLLMENTGAASSRSQAKSGSKFKRLKQGTAVEEPQKRSGLKDFFSDDDDDEEDDRDLRDAGDDDDDDQQQRQSSGSAQERSSKSQAAVGRKYMDELDDFIEDDEFSDMDEDDREEARQRRKQDRLKPTEITGIDSEKVDELYEIFGDGEDYAWALEGEDQDGEFRDDDVRPQLQDIYEPEELKARMLTDTDKIIRDTDIPERYQMMRKNIKNYDLEEGDFNFEKAWVAHKMLSEKRNIDASFDQDLFTKSIADVLHFICKENMDVPFIISQRRDYLLKTNIRGEGDDAQTDVESLLDEPALWRILQLDLEFRALLAKRNQINALIEQLSLDDPILTETFAVARTLSDLQDIYDYINFTYSQQMRDLSLKKSQKQTIYDKVRGDRLYELINAVGIAPNEFAENIAANAKIYPTLDPKETTPTELAEDICMDENSLYVKVSQALEVTKRFYAEALFTNLKIRSNFRSLYASFSNVSIELTEQGRLKIDKNSPYADFKYAINRSHDSFYNQPDLFLRMLEAESQHLVNIKFQVVDSDKFFDSLFLLFSTDGESDVANEWNSFRRDILNLTLKKLIPLITSSIKEDIRRESERLLFFEVRDAFLKKIDKAPYKPPGKTVGDIPRVFAISAGNSRFGMDAVVGSVLDETGKLIETYKFVENPRTPASKLAEGETSFEIAFIEAVRECQPDVVVINGFNVNTHKLFRIVQNILSGNDVPVGDSNEQLEVIYVTDEVAVKFQNSQRAIEEFPDKPSLIRYTIALARYVQSPLLEYVNLGSEVLSLSIHKHQDLLNEDKLKEAIDTALVDIVNMVGVDINKCVSDSYLASVLPYISGLGQRKSVGLLRAVQQHPLFSRQGLIMNENMKFGPTIFTNCASFLRIPQSKHRSMGDNDEIESITVLDDTRIHPEDYALAEKMAADALDYDEDKIEAMKNALPGETIVDNLLELPHRGSDLLKSLVLEDYSRQLEQAYQKKKRATLQMILEELEDPFAELRVTFKSMKVEEVFEALSGESIDTFYEGAIVPVLLKKVNDFRCFALTSSRIECNATAEDAKEATDNRRLTAVLQEGQTVPAKLLKVDYENLTADIGLSPSLIRSGAQRVSFDRSPDVWDIYREDADTRVETQKRESLQRAIRVINHPLFRNFSAGQAQTELAPKEVGSAVIRPSSLGNDHIAITWKVDNNLYQHINVVEHEKENEFSMGRYLTIDQERYQDLDEILNVYVGEIAQRVSQMTQSDKFRKGTHDQVVEWIENFSKANPKRGVYCFAFNYKRPGSFLLLFKTDPRSKLYTWNVRATPKGFDLNGYNYATMDGLRNGFKTLIKNQNQGQQGPAATTSQPGGPRAYNNNNNNNSNYGNTGYGAGYGNGGGYNTGYGNAGGYNAGYGNGAYSGYGNARY